MLAIASLLVVTVVDSVEEISVYCILDTTGATLKVFFFFCSRNVAHCFLRIDTVALLHLCVVLIVFWV